MRISVDEATRRLSSEKNLALLTSPKTATAILTDPPASISADELANEATPDTPGPMRPSVNHNTINRGRKGASVPELLRDVMGGLASMPGADSQREIAQTFGVSQQEVSLCKTGHVGSKPPTAERRAKVEERLETIKDVALDKLMVALKLCDQDKIADLSAKELGRFACDMSKVAQNISPAITTGANISITVYAPEQRREEKYKVLDV